MMMKMHIHDRAGVWFSTLSALGSGLERLFLPLLLCCNFLHRATGVKVSGPPVSAGSSALWDSDTVLSAGSLARMNLSLVNTTGLPAIRDAWVENFGGYMGFTFVDGTGTATSGPPIHLGDVNVPGLQILSFNCTRAGSFALWINVSGVPLKGSPFAFYVDPGPPSYPASVGAWVDGVHDFSIDTQATVAITLVDAFNNDVYLSATDASNNLLVYFLAVQDYTSTIFSKTINRNIESVTFNTQLAGNLTLGIVSKDFKDVKNSPFHLFVSAGPVSLVKSVGAWYPDNTPVVQAGTQAKYVVTQKDRYGNTICPANGNQQMINLTAYVASLQLSGQVDKIVGQTTFTFTLTWTEEYPFTVEDSGHSVLAGLPQTLTVIPGPISPKDCAATLLYSTTRVDGVPLFHAGVPATVVIRLSDLYGNLVCSRCGATNTFLAFTVTLANEPLVAIAQLTWVPTDGSGSQKLTFIPISAGPTVHQLQIGQGTQAVKNTPLSFAIGPGALSPANCTGSWLMGGSHSFGVAGTKVNLRVYMMDCCGNNLTIGNGLWAYPSFSVSMQGWGSVETAYNGGIYGSITTTNGADYVDVTFIPVIAGQGSIIVYASGSGVTAQLQNSPFSIILPAGPVYPPKCFFFFSQGDTFHAGNTALIEVVQVDAFGNVVGPQNYQSQAVQFNGSVYENGVRLPGVTVSLAGPVQGSYNGTWVLTKASDQYSIRLSGLDFKAAVTTYTPVLATDSSFTVLPAEVNASHSVVRSGSNFGDPLPAICMSKTVYAGVNDKIQIELRDAYSNPIASLSQNWNSYHYLKFGLSMLIGSIDVTSTVLSQVTNVPNPDGSSLQAITFLPHLTGQFQIQVTGGMGETPICGKMTLYVMAGSVFVPYCVGSWQSGVSTAQAGSTITLVVLLRDVFNNSFQQQYTSPQGRGFRFNVVRTLGYPNVIQNVLETDSDSNGHSPISFTPLQVGNFQLEVGNQDQAGFGRIIGSPFSFTVTPGDASVSNCVGSWPAGVNKFQAGVNITFQVLMKDRFNNIVSSMNGASSFLTLTMGVLAGDGSRVIPYYNFTCDNSQVTGYQNLYFQMQTMGQFLLQVGSGNQVISGSPFPFTITVGLPMVSQCAGFWSNQGNVFQAGYSTATLNVQLADAFGNAVTVANGGSPLFMFTITVVGVQNTRSVIANVTQIPGQQIRFVPIQVGSYQLSVGSKSNIIGSPFSFTVVPGPLSIRSCIGQWVHDFNLTSGQPANLSVLLKDAVGNTITSTGQTGAFSFSVSVDVGSSNAISNLQVSSPQSGYVYISFVTVLAAQSMKLRVGSMVGGSWQEQISNSPLSFSVNPGPIQSSACTGAWRGGINQYQRPAVAQFLVTQRDSAGNPVYTTAFIYVASYKLNGTMHPFQATLSVVNSGASMAMSGVTWTTIPGQNITSVQILSFTPQQDGYFLLKVFDQFGTILGGPFFIWYFSGHVDPTMCAISGPGLYSSTAGASSSFVIQLNDANGDPAVVTSQLSSLGGITAALHMQNTTYDLEVRIARDPESSSLFVASYTATVAGTYDILVYYAGQVLKKGLVKTVFPGPLDPGTCSAQGPALLGSQKAGTNLTFQVYTYDASSNYVPNTNVLVSVSPTNGARVSNITVDASGVTTVTLAITKAPQTYLVYVMVASNVATTEAGGLPPSMADSSNPTNVAGSPYQMPVQAGSPDPTKCTASGNGLNAHDSLGQWNPIVVTMKDSYGNPASGYSALLALAITGAGDYEKTDFQDQGNGQYLVQFKPVSLGSYQISISLQGAALTGSPWSTTVVGFNLPIANNDSATTMDGSAVAIDVTGNDQVFVGSATVSDIPLAPGNGFVTITRNQLLYTPNHQYVGTDLMGYTIQDGYNRIATAYVALRIDLRPPHVVSMPSIIAGFEGTPLPSYGGITGMSIDYSRPQDVIYVSLNAGHGSVYISQPSAGHISLQGTAASLNSSIQNVHYLGNTHFNGNDTITFSVKDVRGNGDTRFLIVIVQPVNDPPWVQVPSPLQIRSLAVNFAGANMPGIVVGDPDAADVRDDQEELLLVVALEVAGGLLKMTLPVQYRRDISLLDAATNVWVDRPANSLDDEFVNVQGTGIQFVAPVDVCNTALNQLVFAKADLNISVRTLDLFVSVNDGGDWGDCLNCTSNASLPLSMSVIVEIELLDWLTKLENTWSDTLLATRRILGSTAGSVGIACILLVLLVLHLSRKARMKYKALGFVDADELNQELICEQSRIFNPMWIPAAAGDPEFRVSSTPNPLLFNARKHEFRHRLMKVNKEVEREMLLGFKEPCDSSIHRAARPSVFQEEVSSVPEDEGAGAEWY